MPKVVAGSQAWEDRDEDDGHPIFVSGSIGGMPSRGVGKAEKMRFFHFLHFPRRELDFAFRIPLRLAFLLFMPVGEIAGDCEHKYSV